jgi:ABC-2 type transport system permease protein
MIGALRSELVRLRRKGMLTAWLGLTGLFAVLVGTVLFQVVADSTGAPAEGPGVSFPSLAELTSPDGLTAGAASGASFFGVVTLSFWAIAAATDYSSGLIRLLASAQPSRWRLLAGKVGALAAWTAVATTVALLATTAVAPAAARSAGIDTSAWRDGAAGTLASAWLDLYAALLVWGVVGLVLAVLARSSAVAIASGVAYVLVVESVVRSAAERVGDWLPGATLTALAGHGTDAVPYGTALALGAAYAAAGLAAAALVLSRRDITD